MADQTPQDLYTPSNSDDLGIPQQHPVLASSTVVLSEDHEQASATPHNQSATISLGGQRSGDLPVPPSSLQAGVREEVPSSGPAYQQILGRRQRDESDGEESPGTGGESSVAGRREVKRARYTAMVENNGDSLKPSGHNGAGAGTVANGFHGAHRAHATSATNGTVKPSTGVVNGSSRNGKEPARSPTSAIYENLDREEVTRLLIQALSEMGYKDAAESVGRDSGIDLENPTVAAFKDAVLEGEWTRAEQLVDEATFANIEEDRESSYANGLVLASGASKDEMRLHIRRQKFLELIQLRRPGDLERALGVLQTELVPLLRDQPETLRPLAGFLMCRDFEELMAQAHWDGVQGNSRQILLSELSRHISPAVMLPRHRLANLLHQRRRHSSIIVYTIPHRNDRPCTLIILATRPGFLRNVCWN